MPATASRDVAVLKDTAELSCPEDVLGALRATRARTLELIAHLRMSDMERTISPIMSPLVWDLAHIAAYEDLWLNHRHAGIELLRADLAEMYDAFETPRQKRGEIELLDTAQAREYMQEVSERSAATIAEHGVGDGFVHEMVVRHELQHTETMRQTLAIAGLLPAGEPALAASTDAGAQTHSESSVQADFESSVQADSEAGLRVGSQEDWIELPAGSFFMGAGPEGFAYDNERPRHEVHTDAFRIARHPVSRASWLSFSEGGGYERREWWSDEGWAWKEQYDITHHPDALTGEPTAPVCHVSWFEADAFARAHSARLPTEAEWERAATWDQRTEGPPTPGFAGTGQVWEWTASPFGGYPGFRAHPYREYSEVFFGNDYRVLRGSSWATSQRVASLTFRNWDLPIRRQIFAGLRLAKDV